MASCVIHVDGPKNMDLDIEKQVLAAEGATIEPLDLHTEAEIIAQCRDADLLMVVFAPITRRVIESLPRLKGIVRYGVGFDNVDIAAATELGVPVAYVPDYCLEEVSNHTLLLILACARKLKQFIEAGPAGKTDFASLKEQLHHIGAIHDQTLGLLGFGQIAQALARKARALGMLVIAHDPFVDAAAFAELGVTSASREAVLAESDFVSCHLPLNAQTRGSIGEDAFRQMRPGAHFINTSRGAVVDEPALVRAIAGGWIAGAGLDVLATEPVQPDHPLMGRPNVIITPHVAYHSDSANARLKFLAAQEGARMLGGEVPSRARFVNPQVRRGR
jgi:D-3-phosphoglycerate dehydrogenase